jgi:hypothetical protein
LSEFNINRITLAAINTLSVEKSYGYIRNLINDETYKSIQNGEFIIKVNRLEINKLNCNLIHYVLRI